MNTLKGRSYLIAFLVVATIVLVACSEGASSESAVEEVTSQVAFIYTESSHKYNWSHLHEIGRQYLDEQLPDLGNESTCRERMRWTMLKMSCDSWRRKVTS